LQENYIATPGCLSPAKETGVFHASVPPACDSIAFLLEPVQIEDHNPYVKLYAGTSGFAYREWIGKFYPAGISQKEMLGYYAEHFNTVEINNTFYRMPNRELLKGWFNQVPDDFMFTLKTPRVITHIRRLRDVERETRQFVETATELGTNLGAILVQLPPTFPLDTSVLERFLGFLGGTRAAFEFRHPSWLASETLSLLRGSGFALCISDGEQGNVSDSASTADWGYVRLRRSGYPEQDLVEWRERILAEEWGKAFVFFKHEPEGAGPGMATTFLKDR